MRLSEIMSAADLDIYSQIGLVVALIAFAGILFYTFSTRNRAQFERARYAALDGAHEDLTEEHGEAQ